MRVIEFESFVEDGVIRIPEKYQNAAHNAVRVILMPEGCAPAASCGDDAYFAKLGALFGSIDDETFAEPEEIAFADREPL
jgi:hypothetical protein